MADIVDMATRSRMMARIRSKNTRPELLLRKAIHAQGVRFRVHDPSVPGRPDISHKGAKVAVFVDGCFWHGCPRHYRRPGSNQEYWDAKLRYNQDRRAAVCATLEQQGWCILQFWECEVEDRVDAVVISVTEEVQPRRRGGPLSSGEPRL